VSSQQIILVLHLLMIATGIGLSFSNLINIRLALRSVPETGKGLALQRMTVARWGDGVIALIWVTGLLALWQRGGLQGLGGAFHAKLAFVVLLTLAHGFGRYTAGQIKRSGNMGLLPRLGFAVACVWASAVAALVLAVVSLGG
jgi:hypothetical protein